MMQISSHLFYLYRRIIERIGLYLREGKIVKAPILSNESNHATLVPFDGPYEIKFQKVAVIAHVYYLDVLPCLLKYISNIPLSVGLFISTDSEQKKEYILSILDSESYIECCVRVVPNRGRDIAPKLIEFRDVYKRYAVFLHVHSKKSVHHDKLHNWRDYILNGLIGTPDVVRSNLSLLSDDRVGLVYHEHFPIIKRYINWGFDFYIARGILQRCGFHLCKTHTLEFPSGSMFWGRSAALERLLDLDLHWDDFPIELGQIDGTLAHALERSILYCVELSGFEWRRVTLNRSLDSTTANFAPITTIK